MNQTRSESDRETRLWRVAQGVVWMVGFSIFLALIFVPKIGLHAFWNVLIPVAPALLVIGPGIWRNICPMASTALFTRHMNWSRNRQLSIKWNDRLSLVGFLLLIGLIPLRHIVLDTSGNATAILIALLMLVALIVSFHFDWKSAWCSGLCPVHQVERLYGTRALLTTMNAHCHACERCVLLCPDSIPALNPLTGGRSATRRLTGTLMIGGFAGYIYGWFQVPNYSGGEGWSHMGSVYAYPLVGFTISLLLFLVLKSRIPNRHKDFYFRAFACAAVSCYYWFRIPALFGFGIYPGDGMLVDLTGWLPTYFPLVSQMLTIVLFSWLLLLRPAKKRSWAYRPERGEYGQALCP